MQRQFSQHSFSFASDSGSYLYEEPKPLWRRLLPLAVVIIAGTATCYAGLSAGKKMAGEITQLDIVQADPQLTQRAEIGAENPDLMMPQPTLAPPTMLVVSQPKRLHRAPRQTRQTSASRPKLKPAFDPFSDNSIPFQPAEDYTPVGAAYAEPDATHEKSQSPGLEHETAAQANSSVAELKESAEQKPASPDEKTTHHGESGVAPVPVAE